MKFLGQLFMKPEKTAHISQCHYWFFLEMKSEKHVQKFILMTCYYPDLGSTSDWLKICFNQSETLTRSPSDTSSVWIFCARFSDITSRGNQWWCSEMSAVFWGYWSLWNVYTVAFDPQIKHLFQFCFGDYHWGKDKVFHGCPFLKRMLLLRHKDYGQIRCIVLRVCKLRMGFSVPSIIWVGWS